MLATISQPVRHSIHEQLVAEGFRHIPVAPLADLNAIAAMPCDQCEQVGLHPKPYWRPEPGRGALGTLRLVVVCSSCGHHGEV
jgi:hypothetical protein